MKGNINLKKFPPNSLTQAINTIIYGKQSIKKYTQKRKNFHNTILYLHEDDFTIIQWISEKKLYSESRIDLKMVTNISDNPTQNALKKLKKENILVLTVGETKFLALEFPNSQIKNLWWQGIQHFWINSKNENIM